MSVPKFFITNEVFFLRFRPEEKEKRPQLCHMPFGWGPRNCIGMRFALLEAKMALIYILRKYTFVQAPDTEVRDAVHPSKFPYDVVMHI